MSHRIRNSGVLEVSFTLKGKLANKYRFKFVQFPVLLKIFLQKHINSLNSFPGDNTSLDYFS